MKRFWRRNKVQIITQYFKFVYSKSLFGEVYNLSEGIVLVLDRAVNRLSKSCKVCITVVMKLFISIISVLKPVSVLWAASSFFEDESILDSPSLVDMVLAVTFSFLNSLISFCNNSIFRCRSNLSDLSLLSVIESCRGFHRV